MGPAMTSWRKYLRYVLGCAAEELADVSDNLTRLWDVA